MGIRLFTAPAGVPGETTLGAAPEDWQAIADESLKSSNTIAGRLRRKILAAIALEPGARMISISLSNAEADRARDIADRFNISGMPE